MGAPGPGILTYMGPPGPWGGWVGLGGWVGVGFWYGFFMIGTNVGLYGLKLPWAHCKPYVPFDFEGVSSHSTPIRLPIRPGARASAPLKSNGEI